MPCSPSSTLPAEQWKHLLPSNSIESSFATMGLRQRVTKGAGSRGQALTMAFKLLMLAQQRWRMACICYHSCVQIERREDEENRKEVA
ncbi:MAG: hypothetical protein ACREXW_12470 [Gammaproteobacteria bacterium]